MKKTIQLIITGVAMLFLSSVCTAEEKIVICGTGDSQELLRILAKTYSDSHPGTIIDVPDSIGSSGGIKATAEGKCDMGRIARPIKEKEKKFNLNYKVFALSPVVFVANANVTGVNNLSSKQLADIFSGKINRWNAVGGEDADIYVANREEGDSSLSVLKENLPGFNDIQTFAGKTLYSTPEAVETISRYKNTIGYTALSMTKDTDLKIMKVDGVYPSAENVHAGKYKLITPFAFVWNGELKGLSLNFLTYLFSPEAGKIISDNGAMSVREK